MDKKKEYIPGVVENRRLLLQNQLLDAFDYPVYEEVLNSFDAPVRILDVGCNSGDMFIPKLKAFSIDSYLGIDRSLAQIEKAKQSFSEDKFHFQSMDVEASDFALKLEALMQNYRIEKFDFINVSMILLHLSNPQKLLAILRDFLTEGGRIIVRDIDDGLNIAYPDPENWFQRIYQIANEDDMTGNRYTGRKVFHFLTGAGYQDIVLKRIGLSTSGLNSEQKQEFYDMSFQAILDRTKVMLEKYPDEPIYLENYQWAEAHKAEIRNLFLQEDFLATLGFMTYSAR